MNKFLYDLEKRLSKYCIRNLPLVIIMCYVVGYALSFINGGALLNSLTLNPQLVLKGQVWRLVTWVLIPSEGFGFFTLIMLFFYYHVGLSLDRAWGTFRFNLYIFMGLIFTVLGSFVLYFLAPVIRTSTYMMYDMVYARELYYIHISYSFSTYYINLSLFLAYAATFPNHQIMLMFVIPIKVKYLGFVYAAMAIYNIYLNPKFEVIFIFAISLLNFIIFFLMTRDYRTISPSEIKRRNKFKREVREGRTGSARVVNPFKGKAVITRHKCAICQRTELDDESMEFRFCSKCEGNYEYCAEHLFTHQHVTKE